MLSAHAGTLRSYAHQGWGPMQGPCGPYTRVARYPFSCSVVLSLMPLCLVPMQGNYAHQGWGLCRDLAVLHSRCSLPFRLTPRVELRGSGSRLCALRSRCSLPFRLTPPVGPKSSLGVSCTAVTSS
jgi:hypothetical protein